MYSLPAAAHVGRATSVTLLGLALLSGTVAAQDPPTQTFKAAIDVVSLTVTVTGPDGRYLRDLNASDFAIFEDGVKQEIAVFNKQQQPVALSLLLDSSASMENKLRTLQTAAGNFVQRLQPNDLAQVIDFDSRVEIRQTFTGDHMALQAAINLTTAGGSTSLHNALYIALKELKKLPARTNDEVRRQALIVFSDGEDTSSLVSFDEVLDLAKRSETAIYTISLQNEGATRNKGFLEAEFVMRQLAQETGGKAFFARRIEELAGVYGDIADELSSQYSMGYTSRNQIRNGAWRRIVVQMAPPGASARTKRGYYAGR